MKRYQLYLGVGVASLWLVTGLFSVVGYAGTVMPEGGAQPLVRIAIKQNASVGEISIRGTYEVSDPVTGEVLGSGRRMPRVQLVPVRDGIQLGNDFYGRERIRITTRKDITVYGTKNDKRYRENMDIVRNADGNLLLINQVNLEDYIRGVLYHEVSHRWPMEALKTQAVAARTYAMYRKKIRKHKEFDVTNDTFSQVYGGRSAERYRTNLAVKKTRGEILSFNGEVLSAYYHSTCGGVTLSSNDVWQEEILIPLRGAKCNYCYNSPHYKWKRNFHLQDIQEKLNAEGYQAGTIKDIRVDKRTKEGLVQILKITGRNGEVVKVSGKEFRGILGPNLIKSSRYRIKMKGYYCDIIGRGWGHGVGMCQWGTRGMAKQRYNYKTILNYYYPGAKIVRLENL